MVHVDHEDAIEAVLRQLWIGEFSKADRYILEALALDPAAEATERVAIDILRKHATGLAHTLCETHGVVPIARPDIGHGHTGFDLREVHDCFRLAATIPLVFRRELVRTQLGHGPVRRRESWVVVIDNHLSLASTEERERKDQGKCASQSSSSTSTVSPVTRCASAAEMKGSSAPSSTSSGVGDCTPVRRSFTI